MKRIANVRKSKILTTNSKAFSLVEVLCAIVLLALIATPIIQAIFSGMSLNLKSRKLLAASDITSGVMEFASSTVMDDYKYTPTGGSETIVPGLKSIYGGKSGDLSGWKFSGTNADGDPIQFLYPQGPEMASIVTEINSYDTANDVIINRNIYASNVVMDNNTFDVFISINVDSDYTSKMYYCYTVDVEVREPGAGKTGKLLSYASTKVANKY